MLHNFLSRSLSFLGWTTATLFWLDFHQTQSILHWLPVAARIKFKTLMLAYRTTTGSAPTYFHSLMTIYIPSRSLRSANERCLVVPSQRGSKEHHSPEHSLSTFLAGGMNVTLRCSAMLEFPAKTYLYHSN